MDRLVSSKSYNNFYEELFKNQLEIMENKFIETYNIQFDTIKMYTGPMHLYFFIYKNDFIVFLNKDYFESKNISGLICYTNIITSLYLWNFRTLEWIEVDENTTNILKNEIYNRDKFDSNRIDIIS